MAAIVNDRTIRLQSTTPRFIPAATASNGLNQATVLIFRRVATNSAPPLPSATTTWTFLTGVLTGLTNSWTQAMPPVSDGAYLFVSIAQATGANATDTIDPSEWNSARMLYDGSAVVNAQNSADTANAALAEIADDGALSRGEKGQVILDWGSIQAEFNPLQVQADNLGVGHTSFDSTYVALSNYLGSLTPAYNDLTQDTPLIAATPLTAGATFRKRFSDYYTAKISLMNAISAAAATQAVWSSGIAGRPADSALLNSYLSMGADGALAGGGGGQVTLTGMGQKTFRVVSQGGASTTTPIAAGLYKDGTLQQGETRSYTVISITRSTGVIYSATTFDVYGAGAVTSGRDAGTMATHLNSFTPGLYIIVVYSADEPQANRLTAGLDTAMYRHGASRAVYGSQNFQYRAAYILVGVSGCGEGNGSESYQGTVPNDSNAWCDKGFNLVNGVLTGVSSSFTPRTLVDYGFVGDLNATVGAPVNTYVNGVLSQDLTTQASTALSTANTANNTATTVNTTLNTPPVISSISNVNATNVYKPATTIATKTPGVSNGTAPFIFDWRVENITVGDVDITYTVSTVTNTNDKNTIKAISQVTGGLPSQDLVTVTVTDAKGRVSITQFTVNASC